MHAAISPDPTEHYLIREYCANAGIGLGQVQFIEGSSQDILPAILGHERTLDLAFIDGAHSYPAPANDWFYIARSLKVGGTLMLSCIEVPSVAQVFRHMQRESNWQLEKIVDDRVAVFTMLSPPAWIEDDKRQGYNRGYPDYSFASLPRKLQLRACWQIRQVRARRTSRAHRRAAS